MPGARNLRMKVNEIMRPAPWVVEGIDSLGAAHALMQQHHIRHLPVVRDGKLVGLLTEHDILAYRAELPRAEDWTSVAVSGAMVRTPQTAAPDDSITEITARFAADTLDALPVVERGRLIGIITVTDVLAAEVRRAMAVSPRAATAGQVMAPGPFTCGPDDDLLAAATRMSVHGVRHLPVVDGSGRVIGMLSDRDVRTHVGDPSRFAIAGSVSYEYVRDAMTPAPITVTADRSLDEIARIFEDHQLGAVPVVDDERRLVGIVSYVDVLRGVAHAA